MKTAVWNPYEKDTYTLFMTKGPTHFLVTEIFFDDKAEEFGYQAFDNRFGMMGAARHHTFHIITNNGRLAREYYSLRSKHLGMRDLGRTIWGKMLEPPKIAPDWCFVWPLVNIKLYIREIM